MNKITNLLYHFTHFIKNTIEQYKNIDFSFSNKHIVIFLGDDGVVISVFQEEKLIDYRFINKTKYDSNEDIKFLAKFSGYRVFFVLDTSDIVLNHSDIPVSHGIVYQNPLTKFIATKFDKDRLVSSNVYNITKSDQDIYNSIFASVNISNILSKLLDYTTFNGFDVNGIYFFSLNAPLMIDNILQNQGIVNHKDSLYIFITITSVSKIRILVLSGDNVMQSQIMEYPEDKGDPYIQGVIEQAVIDCLISLKNYMHHNKIEPTLFILVHDSLKTLLLESDFKIEKKIILSNVDFKIDANNAIIRTSLSDYIIGYFLNKKTHYHASNNRVNEYLWLKGLNKFLSTPWYILISMLVIGLLSIEVKSVIQENKTHEINRKFYLLSEDYRKSRKEYPNISNLEDVVNLYYAEKLLNTDQKLPFNTLNTLLSSLSSNFTISKISWQYYEQKSHIISNIRYQISTNDISYAIAQLNKEIDSLKIAIPEKEITFNYNQNEILNSSNAVTIYLELSIIW